jgi:WD40 repeat protein
MKTCLRSLLVLALLGLPVRAEEDDPRTITPGGFYLRCVAWSRDGKFLAVGTGEGKSKIRILDAQGTELKALPNGP